MNHENKKIIKKDSSKIIEMSKREYQKLKQENASLQKGILTST